MTINYKEKPVSGSEWQRCSGISIINSYNAIPIIRFQEEVIVEVSGNILTKPLHDGLSISYTPTKTFNILNPSDNTPTGATMTHQEVYNILYSLYIQTALERDNPTPP